MTERTAVYRLYDAKRTLLYVGISNDFGRRWKQHADIQPWWPDVDYQTVHWHPSREAALIAEKAAIAAERPAHNVHHVPKTGLVQDELTGFPVPGQRRPDGTVTITAEPREPAPSLIPDPAGRFGRPPVDAPSGDFARALGKRYDPAPAWVPDLSDRYGNVCDLVIQLLWPEKYATGPGDPHLHTSTPARQIANLIFQAAGIRDERVAPAWETAVPGTCGVCGQEKIVGEDPEPPHGTLCLDCLSGLMAFGRDPGQMLAAAVFMSRPGK